MYFFLDQNLMSKSIEFGTQEAVLFLSHLKINEKENKMSSMLKRSLVKTITWRVIATLDTFLISWFITGKLVFAGAIASLEIITKMFLYFLHERGWAKIKWGRL